MRMGTLYSIYNRSCVVWEIGNVARHDTNRCLAGLSPITTAQNIRLILYLGSATGKEFNTHKRSSSTTRPKRELFLQMSLQEREYSDLDYASPDTRNGSSVYLLKAMSIQLETHLGFGSHNESTAGDSLNWSAWCVTPAIDCKFATRGHRTLIRPS
jgi:hypothetical protein